MLLLVLVLIFLHLLHVLRMLYQSCMLQLEFPLPGPLAGACAARTGTKDLPDFVLLHGDVVCTKIICLRHFAPLETNNADIYHVLGVKCKN